MFETKRKYSLKEEKDPATLAYNLTQCTWTLCTAWFHNVYLFFNDATSEDGAGEYAVYKLLTDGQHKKIESVTFSWMTEQEALTFLAEIDTYGDVFKNSKPTTISIEHYKDHRCPACA